jgi:hypothetical protein
MGLGDFFTNASGHHDYRPQNCRTLFTWSRNRNRLARLVEAQFFAALREIPEAGFLKQRVCELDI